MSSQLMLIHCLSPLHAGVGQGVDVVDLAIARDRATGLPYLPGSSIKGSLRDRAYQGKRELLAKVFGPETANASDHAGCLSFGDGNLVFLPVRSVAGTFAYVTSPYALQRLSRDLVAAGLPKLDGGFAPKDVETVMVVKDSSLTAQNGTAVYFEDFNFTPQSPEGVEKLADTLANLLFAGDAGQQDLFKKRFCIVHDDVLSFLAKHATDIVTRVSIENDTKTAKSGQLWTEENLPSESILVSLVTHIPVSKTAVDAATAFGEIAEITRTEVQFGGKATVGRGRCRVALSGGAQ